MKTVVSKISSALTIFLCFSALALAGLLLLVEKKNSNLLIGVKEQQAKLVALREKVKTTNQVVTPVLGTNLIWPNGEIGEKELQRVVLEALQSFDQTVQNYQRTEPTLDDIGRLGLLTVEFEGPLLGLLNFLDFTEQSTPPIATQNLQIQAMSDFDQVEGETMVTTRMTLWGYLHNDETQ